MKIEEIFWMVFFFNCVMALFTQLGMTPSISGDISMTSKLTAIGIGTICGILATAYIINYFTKGQSGPMSIVFASGATGYVLAFYGSFWVGWGAIWTDSITVLLPQISLFTTMIVAVIHILFLRWIIQMVTGGWASYK